MTTKTRPKRAKAINTEIVVERDNNTVRDFSYDNRRVLCAQGVRDYFPGVPHNALKIKFTLTTRKRPGAVRVKFAGRISRGWGPRSDVQASRDGGETWILGDGRAEEAAAAEERIMRAVLGPLADRVFYATAEAVECEAPPATLIVRLTPGGEDDAYLHHDLRGVLGWPDMQSRVKVEILGVAK